MYLFKLIKVYKIVQKQKASNMIKIPNFKNNYLKNSGNFKFKKKISGPQQMIGNLKSFQNNDKNRGQARKDR